MPLETIHIILSAGSLLVLGLLAYMGLKVKLDVSEGKNEVMRTTQEIAGKLETHIQLDNVKHAEIDRHLEYTDRRVDRLEGYKT